MRLSNFAWMLLVGAGALDDPLRELERDLKAAHPKTRRGAVRKLAELDKPEAWKLVIEALADRESEVADEAELDLARVRDAKSAVELFGKSGLESGSAIVRARAAEALGRAEFKVDGAELLRSVSARDAEASRLALWSIERLVARDELVGNRAQIVQRVEDCVRSSLDAEVRAAGLCALFALDKTRAAAQLPELLASREPILRSAAIRIAGELGDARSFEIVNAALADPAASVRVQAIVALEARKSPAAMRALASVVEKEPRSRSKWRAVEALQRFSGLKYKLEPAPWKVWANGLPETWKPDEGPPAPKSPNPSTPSSSGGPFGRDEPLTDTHPIDDPPTLAGLPILSDRFAFLVDFSGSMWAERKSGATVKEIVDREIGRAIDGLANGVRFDLVPYSSRAEPWSKTLVAVDAGSKRRALDFFVHCRLNGRGDLWGAATAMFADPELDSFVIWTDGVPTGGVHSNLELVVPLLLERNRFRNLCFDVALVDAPKGSIKRWHELARESGGRTIELELDRVAAEPPLKRDG